MTTWIQVMALVRSLDAKRRGGQRLDGEDAETLITILLDFHQHAVEPTPTPSGSSPVGQGAPPERHG